MVCFKFGRRKSDPWFHEVSPEWRQGSVVGTFTQLPHNIPGGVATVSRTNHQK